MNKEITKRRNIMKKGILKGVLIVVLLFVAGTAFASGLLAKDKKADQEKVGKVLQKHTVTNGYIITQGWIFEPPFELILSENGIWAKNSERVVSLEKMRILPSDDERRNEEIRFKELDIKQEIGYHYLEYFYKSGAARAKQKIRKYVDAYDNVELEAIHKDKIIVKSQYGNTIEIPIRGNKELTFNYIQTEYIIGRIGQLLTLISHDKTDNKKETYDEIKRLLEMAKTRRLIEDYEVAEHYSNFVRIKYFNSRIIVTHRRTKPAPKPIPLSVRKDLSPEERKYYEELEKQKNRTPFEVLEDLYKGKFNLLNNDSLIIRDRGWGAFSIAENRINKVKSILNNKNLCEKDKFKLLQKTIGMDDEYIIKLIKNYWDGA